MGRPNPFYIFTPPVFPVEKEVIKALNIRNITGAAFLPDYYVLQSDVAISGLARARNWAFSDYYGFPIVDPLPTEPLEPFEQTDLSPLLPIQKYVLSLLGKIVQFALNNPDWNGIQDYVNALSLPTGYTLVNDSSYPFLLEFTFQASTFSFKLAGYFDDATAPNQWRFQRWISPTAIGSEVFNDEFSLPMPYEPNTGDTYFDTWYDIDLVNFEDACNDDLLIYSLVIKSGETYKFNILPDQGNFWGLSSFDIGIFDSNQNLLQNIGTAVLPFSDLVYTITISGSEKATVVSDVAANMVPTFIKGIASDESETTLITVPFADTDTGSVDLYAQSIIDYINAQDGYEASFVNGTDLVFTISILGSYAGIVSLLFSAYTHDFESNSVDACVSTQLQATVLIPYLTKGCYQFGLYNEDEYGPIVYSFSQVLSLDDFECFTQILEYSSFDNAIQQGFEYFADWSQVVRVPISEPGDEQSVIEDSEYRQSNGVFRRPSTKTDLSVSLHSDWNDKSTQLAIAAATQHDRFILAQIPLFVFGDLEVDHPQTFTTETSYFELAQTRFKAKIQKFQPLQSDCLNC